MGGNWSKLALITLSTNGGARKVGCPQGHPPQVLPLLYSSKLSKEGSCHMTEAAGRHSEPTQALQQGFIRSAR